MNTNQIRGILLPLSTLLLALLACYYPGQTSEYNSATATMQALATRVAEVELAQSAEDPSESSAPSTSDDGIEPTTEAPAQPTVTPTPSETPSPTPCIPSVSVSTNTNCRSGPGQAYDYLGALLTGEEAEIVGQSSVSNYYVIDNPDNPGQDCWLWGQYAQVVCDTSGLPVLTPPPTPTPTYPDWSGTWTTWCDAEDPDPFTVHINQSGDQLWGEYSYGGTTYTFEADLSNNGTHAYGRRYHPDHPALDFYLFWDILENRNQFQGSIGGNWGPWCGARNGASKPSPCKNY
jgi:hypothetical protein